MMYLIDEIHGTGNFNLFNVAESIAELLDESFNDEAVSGLAEVGRDGGDLSGLDIVDEVIDELSYFIIFLIVIIFLVIVFGILFYILVFVISHICLFILE